tara:strand:+ start:512 stop:643 length:132 start_codon:yes stop_codon:yes gene_type:complete
MLAQENKNQELISLLQDSRISLFSGGIQMQTTNKKINPDRRAH